MTFGEVNRENYPVLRLANPDEHGGSIGCEIVFALLESDVGILDPLKIRLASNMLKMFKPAEQDRFWQLILEDKNQYLWPHIETLKSEMQ